MVLASSTTVLPANALQSLGPLAEPPALLVALVVLIAIVIVGRILLAIAWRLVLIALGVVIGLWVLGMLGFQTGFL